MEPHDYATILNTKHRLTWPQVSHTISKLPLDHTEYIYSLIVHYAVSHIPKIKALPPYEISVCVGGKGLMVNGDKLPSELKQIIFSYVELISEKEIVSQ